MRTCSRGSCCCGTTRAGCFTAIVVVDAVNDFDRWDEARGWTREDAQRGC